MITVVLSNVNDSMILSIHTYMRTCVYSVEGLRLWFGFSPSGIHMYIYISVYKCVCTNDIYHTYMHYIYAMDTHTQHICPCIYTFSLLVNACIWVQLCLYTRDHTHIHLLIPVGWDLPAPSARADLRTPRFLWTCQSHSFLDNHGKKCRKWAVPTHLGWGWRAGGLCWVMGSGTIYGLVRYGAFRSIRLDFKRKRIK